MQARKGDLEEDIQLYSQHVAGKERVKGSSSQ